MKISQEQVYQFDGLIFVETRKKLERLEKAERSATRAFKQLSGQFAQFGLTGFETLYLSEDDGQSNTDIKVFVCARLTGQLISTITESDAAPEGLAQLLESFSRCICGDDYVPENWELLSIEDLATA